MNEDNVIDGAINYLKFDLQRRSRKFIADKRAQAKDNDHGIDLRGHALSNGKWSTRYYIEAKGTRKVGNNLEKSSPFEYEFRWAISQIVLQMKEFSGATNYGIAIPMTEKKTALKLMKDNKGLKTLKIRLYLAYKADNGEYSAQELTPRYLQVLNADRFFDTPQPLPQFRILDKSPFHYPRETKPDIP